MRCKDDEHIVEYVREAIFLGMQCYAMDNRCTWHKMNVHNLACANNLIAISFDNDNGMVFMSAMTDDITKAIRKIDSSYSSYCIECH